MKTYRLICSMILISCSCIGADSSWSGEEFRVFISADGRSIAGKLVDYDPDKQMATIARNDGRVFPALLEHFSEPDQRYIREQSALKDYMLSLRILPQLKQFHAAGKYDGIRHKSANVQLLGYGISLQNPSPTLFKEIVIEYCLFYRQGERHESGMEYSHGVQYGRRELDSIEPDTAHILESEKVLIYTTGSACTLFGGDREAQGGVDGIWLRIAATLPNGTRVLREVQSSPLTGSYHNWVTTAIPVGLNTSKLSLAHF